METTPKIYSVKEILDLYPKKLKELKPGVFKFDNIEDVKISPNVFLPIWGQSYQIAKNTFNYLNNLSDFGLKIYVAVFSKGKLKHFVKYIQNPKVRNSSGSFISNLDESVKFTPKDIENLKKKKYSLMNCILKPEVYNSEIEEKHPYHRLLEKISDSGISSISDGMYIFSLRDTLLARFDNKHPWIGYGNFRKGKKFFSHKPSKLLPIFNTTGGKDYMDIPIIEFESLSYVNKLYYSKVDTFEGINLDWESKKNIAIFRGGATGCGYNEDNNQRLKLLSLAEKLNSDFLDVGITSAAKKYIFDETGKIGFIDLSDIKIKEKMNKVTQSNYKYIIIVEGNVSAHRIATDMLFNSVVLLIDSIYNVWISYLLKPYVHYIPIKSDLSDLIFQIKWCIDNEEKCKKIASNARELALEVLNYDYIRNHLINGLSIVNL
jgi:hypothetical protein